MHSWLRLLSACGQDGAETAVGSCGPRAAPPTCSSALSPAPTCTVPVPSFATSGPQDCPSPTLLLASGVLSTRESLAGSGLPAAAGTRHPCHPICPDGPDSLGAAGLLGALLRALQGGGDLCTQLLTKNVTGLWASPGRAETGSGPLQCPRNQEAAGWSQARL